MNEDDFVNWLVSELREARLQSWRSSGRRQAQWQGRRLLLRQLIDMLVTAEERDRIEQDTEPLR